ncbi:hypothetical protein SAMN05216548_110134 [Faunimonas pinastri]|uniref:Entericidin n=1 Tax=Faunimonas pinastri TaxID=1855383 RepID=A0A1H9KYL2_9HYPH|nr:hypothetical protein [Faunimonas pinastri]SER04331.1 hypothetical protein SAMN05216548_110134 [Faunimonas pinastri]
MTTIRTGSVLLALTLAGLSMAGCANTFRGAARDTNNAVDAVTPAPAPAKTTTTTTTKKTRHY